jgi:hypothetical protein
MLKDVALDTCDGRYLSGYSNAAMPSSRMRYRKQIKEPGSIEQLPHLGRDTTRDELTAAWHW